VCQRDELRSNGRSARDPEFRNRQLGAAPFRAPRVGLAYGEAREFRSAVQLKRGAPALAFLVYRAHTDPQRFRDLARRVSARYLPENVP
jgi:hypothetical protein